MANVDYIDSYPRRWYHEFPEVEDRIPEAFAEVGNAIVLKKAGTRQFLVNIDMYKPIKVRHDCLYDDSGGIAINGTTGACCRWDAEMSVMPENGATRVRIWLDYYITVYKEKHPNNRTVAIDELVQRYRAFASEMLKVWEIIG